ncbi:hypothetical protein PPYR_06887 [Photinus pyralis]|uniref:Uncharacterized protein n=2 Tax=Photinus pyralis TaxID=7054 RepID=A0A1Y1LH73_PHOPY|nr:G1/S-specific cyclin-D2-like [Photinus pyralis]KAB0799007.1 hypothetical protein PPYR_06887 [Photinus pyralis]
MDLICCELPTTETRAYPDQVLLSYRVLNNLLKSEEQYALPASFLRKQTEVTPQMRKIVAEWMMEVCDEQNCQDEVFPIAVNFMDRFLAVRSINKSHLQLLGTSCMLVASKLREPKPLPAQTLVFYTDNSITIEDLRKCELLVVSKLKWDLTVVTPQDFLAHILRRLPVESIGIKYNMVNSHAKTLIALCARDFDFTSYLPSTIASATVASALCGLGWTSKSGRTFNDLLQMLHEITNTEQDYILDCFKQIENMVRVSSSSSQSSSSCSTHGDLDNFSTCSVRADEFTPPPSTSDKLQEQESAGTPTDVRDIHF